MRRAVAAAGGLALGQILAAPAEHDAAECQLQLRRASTASYVYGSPAECPLEPGAAPHGLMFHDLPRMLRRLDCSLDDDDDDDEDNCDGNPGGGISDHGGDARLSVDCVIDQMRSLAGASSSVDIANAAQQIMGYLERESQRRQRQSERHHVVAAALADILAQSDPAPAAP
ncbi:hypothetical protein LPJ61_005231, partial [Coemansia biformis]